MANRAVQAWVALTKPRLLLMVLVTTALGYWLAAATEPGAAGGVHAPLPDLLALLAGTTLAGGGSSILNQYLERDADARMERTRRRPLVTGEVEPLSALIAGVTGVLAGVILLLEVINVATAFVVLFTAFLYVLVYTPLKRHSWLNTTVGAIPGALPPVAGWVAATGDARAAGAWILFAILWAWQHPHFYAIAWMHRDDYARGGFRMLGEGVGGDARATRGILGSLTALVAISFLPAWAGWSGMAYLVAAALLGAGFAAYAIRLARMPTRAYARGVFGASLVYLPLLLVALALDLHPA